MITPVGQEFQVNTYTSNDQRDPKIAFDINGGFVITWTSYVTTSIIGGQEFINSRIFAQRYTSDSNPLGSEFQVNSNTNLSVSLPSIAADVNGDFVITWSGFQMDNGDNIYAQRFNSAGIPQGSEFRVNTNNNTSVPEIAIGTNGDFIITWADFNLGIFAQRYNRDGIAQGGEFQVNTITSGRQLRPEIASDINGDFIITWVNFVGGLKDSIYAQRYNREGIPQGSSFQVNTTPASIDSAPGVAIDANGDFVVTWESAYVNDGRADIYAQRFNNEGITQGGEFKVNTFTTGAQYSPQTANNADGGFIITWHSSGQDGSDFGIYARYYNSAAIPQGSEFRVNSFTTGRQFVPAIATDGDSNFVVAWRSSPQDGSGYGVYAQRYTTSNTGGLYLTGTDASESLEGSEFADIIAGAGGDDTIRGGDGNDYLQGNRGNDSLAGNSGDDLVFGGQGNDLLDGGEGNDSVFGGAGNDTANGGIGNDLIGGGLDNDRLDGEEGNDLIFGGRGNDLAIGGAGNDTLNGISPFSTNQGQGEVDTLTGGTGRDVFVLAAATRNYYDDGNSNSPGLGDYALITDFNLSEGDSLQLRSVINYVISNAPASLGLTGAGLFIDTDNSGDFSTNDELIAVVLNVTPTDLLNATKISV